MNEQEYQEKLYDQKFEYIKEELSILNKKMDDLSGLYMTKSEGNFLNEKIVNAKEEISELKRDRAKLAWSVIGTFITGVVLYFFGPLK